MTLLVTGGSGLVGSRLLGRLVERGASLRAIVRPERQLPAGVERVEGDILDAASIAEAVKGVSAIIHLAAVFRTPDTDLIWKVNLEGTRNLIAAAKKSAPDARFIMASTNLVYDRNSPRPGRENDAVNPQLAYPASKVAAETELRASSLNWSILRFGFVYGDKDGHMESLPKLAAQFELHPAVKFSLIHHRDIATAVDLALTGALDKRIVNLVDEAPTSLFEMTEIVGDPMVPSSEPLANPWYGQADGRLARSLGLKLTVPTVHQAIRENAL